LLLLHAQALTTAQQITSISNATIPILIFFCSYYLIGDNVALGLQYSLAAEAAGITYQTFNSWINKGHTDKSGKYYYFYQYIQRCNANCAKKLLERLKSTAKAGDTWIFMWILERRFSADFSRREYRKQMLSQIIKMIMLRLL
jgi:hypothetical protein